MMHLATNGVRLTQKAVQGVLVAATRTDKKVAMMIIEHHQPSLQNIRGCALFTTTTASPQFFLVLVLAMVIPSIRRKMDNHIIVPNPTALLAV